MFCICEFIFGNFLVYVSKVSYDQMRVRNFKYFLSEFYELKNIFFLVGRVLMFCNLIKASDFFHHTLNISFNSAFFIFNVASIILKYE